MGILQRLFQNFGQNRLVGQRVISPRNAEILDLFYRSLHCDSDQGG